MKAARGLTALRARLADAEETLRAIRAGEVDTVMVPGEGGPQVFTLQDPEHAYRTLIECMNEGALTLTTDKTILYANQCFAKMVKRPLEQVIGGSFRSYLSPEDRATLRPLLKRADEAGAKIQVTLHAADGSCIPAQISIRPLGGDAMRSGTAGIVVTDMTQARRSEVMLRALTHRVVQVQETERGRVALELHDHITQLLCATLLRARALADGLSPRGGPAKKEAAKLCKMLGETAEEVERISRGLRPGVLEQLGLVAVLRSAGREFADRTGASVEQVCAGSTARLRDDVALALYRIFQEALKNVERHARARHVAVGLTQQNEFVGLSITDDGIGFDPDHLAARRRRVRGLGVLGMRERAAYVGGVVEVVSAPGEGTTIRARIPVGGSAAAPTSAWG